MSVEQDVQVTLENLVKEKQTYESLIRDLDQKVAAYENLGSPEQIGEVFDKVEGLIQKVGTMTESEDTKEKLIAAEAKLDAYAELGTPEEVEECLDKATALFEAYAELGTPEEIEEALNKSESYIVKLESQKLSKEFGVGVDTVAEMVNTYESFDRVREVLENLLRSKAGKTDETTNESVVTTVPAVRRIAKMTSGL